ncbi:mCG146506, partial [Mus musculus]
SILLLQQAGVWAGDILISRS